MMTPLFAVTGQDVLVALGASGGIGALAISLYNSYLQFQVNKAKQDGETRTATAVADKTTAEAESIRLKAESERTDFTIHSMRQEIDRLNKRVEFYESRVNHLEDEVADYRKRMFVLETAGREAPVAAWELDNDERYIKVNKAFDTILLTPMKDEKGKSPNRGDILGKTAREFWGEEVADNLHILNTAASKSIDHTACTCGFYFRPGIGPFIVVKCIRIWEGQAIGIFGMAIPMTTEVVLTKTPCDPPKESKPASIP